MKASSSDVRWFVDATPRLRVGGHLRFHVQSAVSFWQLAYVATMTPAGPRVPALRTEARELGALYTPTEGLDFRILLDRRGRFALTLGADMGETEVHRPALHRPPRERPRHHALRDGAGMRPAALLLLLLLLAAPGCPDPVLDAQIDALPGEVPGIRTGPSHRAGQPCTDCHSSYGGRHPIFTVAGTLFQKPTNKVGVEGAVVHVTDVNGDTRDLTTNCVGNFYVADTDWEPAFPILVTIEDPQTGLTATMKSKVGRDTSCASCHVDPAGTDSPGHVYLTKDPTVPDAPVPPLTCGSDSATMKAGASSRAHASSSPPSARRAARSPTPPPPWWRPARAAPRSPPSRRSSRAAAGPSTATASPRARCASWGTTASASARPTSPAATRPPSPRWTPTGSPSAGCSPS